MSLEGELIARYKQVRARLQTPPATVRRKTPETRPFGRVSVVRPFHNYIPPRYSQECVRLHEEDQIVIQPYIEPIEFPFVTIPKIRRVVCAHYNVTPIDVVSNRRQARIVRARHVAMYLSRTLTTYSYPKIGQNFGNRDHSTILHAVRNIEAMIERDPAFAETVAILRARVIADMADGSRQAGLA